MAVWRGIWTIDHPSLGGTGTNTWHARTSGAGDFESEGATLNALNTALGEFYVACSDIFAGGTHLHFNGEWVRAENGQDAIHRADPNDFVVTGSAPPLPPANCLVVGWGTSVASKRGRGRTFLGPLRVASAEDNGTPTEPDRTLVEGAAADLVDSFDGIGDGALGVWSVTDQVLRDFTDGRVANRFAVLRSRRD